MNENLLQNLHTISNRPINFFSFTVDCHRLPRQYSLAPLTEHYLLPDTSRLCKELSFAKVKIGWNEDGIAADITIQKKPEYVLLPEIHFGDGAELFIDTRDRKTAGANTRFCHHFGFIPKECQNPGTYAALKACELTRFRTEDKHELCPPQDLLIESHIGRGSYQLLIFIPSHCLYGFDPHQFERIGFTYRLNRYHHLPQHFHVVAEEFSIEQNPAHWASLRLMP